jgi:hypothetical protein
MRGRLAVALLAAALFVFGLWAGSSYGEVGGITQPQVLELFTKGCDSRDATCRFFPLEDDERRKSGTIARGNQPLFDMDGNVVGRHRLFCAFAGGTGWFCSRIETIKAGPHTERGTITVSGLFRLSAGGSGDPSKFDTFAVTGGSGAYSNVRGYATEGWDPNREAFAHTFYLTP